MLEVLKSHDTQIVTLSLILLSMVGCVGAMVLRDRQNSLRTIPVFLCVLLGVLSLVAKGSLGYALLLASAVVSWWAAKGVGDLTISVEPKSESRVTALLAAFIGATLVGFAFYRLGDYTSTALTWESPVIEDLLAELRAKESLMTSFENRLGWNHAVLSGGANSMVFGFPALVAMRFLSADMWSLRLPAAIGFLGGCAAIFLLTRRMFGLVVATSAVGIFGLNQLSLIYARYGTSAAGSLCALLVSLLFCVRLVETQRLVWVPLTVVSLYLATLGYAPARVPVLLLLVMTPLGVIVSAEFSARRKLAVLVALALALVPVVAQQIWSHSVGFYFAGRGEQLFGMLATSYWPDQIKSLQTIASATKPLTPGEIVGVGIELVRQVTGPQLLSLLDPISPEIRQAVPPTIQPFHDDPLFLKLIAPTLTPFVFLGVCVSARGMRRWLSMTLVLWIAGCWGSALLSNRVDDHRLLFTIIPLSIWSAIGIGQYVKVCKSFRCPYMIIVASALALCSLAALSRSACMYDPPGQQNPVMVATREVVREIPTSNVTLLADIFHREMAVLRLDLWRDELANSRRVRWLSSNLKDAIQRGTILYRPSTASEVADVVKKGSTLVLYPANRYKQVASRLAQESLSVFSRQVGSYSFLIISANREPYAPVLQRAILPEIPITQRALPVLPEAQGVPLSSMTPIRSKYGFSEMRLNRTWGGNPLLLSGVSYQSGVGTHAPTTLSYKVPTGATSFQAIVGIDDDAQICARGSTRVVLRDQAGGLLHQTGVVTNLSPTSLVVNVSGVSELEISVEDAGDGRDCDHVDVVDALFVVPDGSAAACVCPKLTCSNK